MNIGLGLQLIVLEYTFGNCTQLFEFLDWYILHVVFKQKNISSSYFANSEICLYITIKSSFQLIPALI